MLSYVPGDGPLHRAHPFTPFVLALTVAALVFVLPPPVGPFVVCGAMLALPLVERVPSVFRSAGALALPFWFFLLLIHGVFRAQPLTGIVVATRLTAIVFAFATVLSAVHPARMVEALVARRVPFAVTYLFAATLQAVPRLRARARGILEAQQCRGLHVRGSVGRRVRAVVPLALPLVFGALAEVDERAVALESRGAGAGVPRTALAPPEAGRVDTAVRVACAVGLIGAVVLRIAW